MSLYEISFFSHGGPLDLTVQDINVAMILFLFSYCVEDSQLV